MLIGEKTRLRPMERSDLPQWQVWMNDPELVYWASGGYPDMTMFAMDVLEKLLEREQGGDTSARFAVETLDGRFIGTVGYRQMDRQSRTCVVNVSIGEKGLWGTGYGTDALHVLLRYLFLQWNLHRVELDTWDGNERAVRSYLKLGFVEEGRMREARYVHGEYRDKVVMGLLRREFLALEVSRRAGDGRLEDGGAPRRRGRDED